MSAATNALHEFQAPGRYLVSLTVEDASGRTATASTIISVVASTPTGTSTAPAG